MKTILKCLLVVTITLFAVDSMAQRAVIMPLATGDTCTDAGTVTKIFQVTGGYNGVWVQANVRKLSGTVAGTVQLFGSNDGTTYVQIGSDATATNTAGTKGYSFIVSGPLPQYIKVLETGTGTMSAVLTVEYRLPFYQPPF